MPSPENAHVPDMASADDVVVAAAIAEEAGKHLMRLRMRTDLHGDALGAEGDRSANELILGRLAAARPHDAVLSEESADDRIRLGRDRVWIVDPLDGTREYPHRDRSDWAVHIALWHRTPEGGRLACGAVAIPARGEIFTGTSLPMAVGATDRSTKQGTGQSTEQSGHSTGQSSQSTNRLRIIASASRPQPEAERLAEQLDGDLLRMGSAGAKTMALLRGEADIYVHSGGQYEWDSAAPVVVAVAAGFVATRIDGSALLYNQADTFLPDLLICRPQHHGAVVRLLAGVA
jgi:3'(2'), 5'-bisphosphate nucleotidase